MDVTSIRTQPSWGKSPARTRRSTGEVFFNEEYLGRPDLNQNSWALFLAHERGHIVENTTDEIAADEFARREYFPSGRSLRDSANAMLKVLDWNNPAHRARIMRHVSEAARFDCEVNNSCTAAEKLATGTNLKKYPGFKKEKMTTSIDQGINEATHAQEVLLNRGASVLDNYTDCGASPTLRDCGQISGVKFVARRNCKQENENRLSAWNKCTDQNNQEKKTQLELDAANKNIVAESEKARLAADTSLKLQKEQSAADKAAGQEKTKQLGMSKTGMYVAVVAVVLGVALMMFFLFRKKKAA